MTITKKIILIISVILFAIPTYAVDMCASENAIVFVLDPNIGHSSSSYDVPTSTWRVVFPYGTITGISACLNYNPGQSDQANNGTVLGGEQLGYRCWCKMTHPAVSKWVLGYDYGSGVGTSGCVSRCAQFCSSLYSSGSSSDVANRKTLFKTITN